MSRSLRILAQTLVGLLIAAPSQANAGAASTRFAAVDSVVARSATQVAAPLRPGDAASEVFRFVIENAGAEPETLTSVQVTNTTSGPGSTADLDQSWSQISLVSQSNSTTLATASFSSGSVVLGGFALIVPPGESAPLSILGAASVSAKDSDRLDLRIDAATDFSFTRTVSVFGTLPLDPSGDFVVDGMSANQIVLVPIGSTALSPGSSNNVALDIALPPNGYQPDVLQKINVANLGTATDGTTIVTVNAWIDDGNGLFDALSDRLLGPLPFTGDRWELTGITEAVPLSGLHVFMTVDIAQDAPPGGTVRLALAETTDRAIGMASGNDGPVDRTLENPFEQAVSPVDRVTFTTAPLAPGTVQPGAQGVHLIHLIATNNYSVSKTLTTLTLTNVTQSLGLSTTAQRDGELQVIALRVDGDDDGQLDDTSIDPLVGASLFESGALSFRGLMWNLPAGTTRHLFVTGDISVLGAADGDVIGVNVDDGLDVDFSDATSTAAAWPLDSGARWTVNGMVAAQLPRNDVPGLTLGPGDGPVLALHVDVPANGYKADVLQGIEVTNLGTATNIDLAELRLWADGGDDIFDAGAGDDSNVGPLVWLGSSWTSPQLTQSLNPGGTHFFVTVQVSAAPTDSATVQLSIPVGGIVVESGNDGPIDAPVTNSESILLSPAPLLTSISLDATASVVGQDVTMRMLVRNISPEVINGITPVGLSQSGGGSLTLLSGPAPASFNLAPGATDTFTVNYQAASVGEVRVTSLAEGTGGVSLLTRRSITASSGALRVLVESSQLGMFPVGNMPFSITRGQTSVVPLNLTFNIGVGSEVSDVLLRQLRVRFEDGSGAGIVPGALVSRLVVSEGTNTYLSTTSLPTIGDEAVLSLTSPVVVTGTEPVTVSIRLDISPTTIVPEFRLAILDATWLTASDATSGSATPINLQSGSFPLLSGLGQLNAAPSEVSVARVPAADATASPQQADVSFLTLRLNNPGIDGLTSDVRVGSINVSLLDASDVIVADPSTVLRRLRIREGIQVFAERSVNLLDNATMTLPFVQPIDVAANSTRDLVIAADLQDSALLGTYKLQVSGADQVEARDANTDSPVAVLLSEVPLRSSTLEVQAAADSVLTRGSARLAATTIIGASDHTAMSIELRHPGTAEVGRIHINSLTVLCRNELRNPVIPSDYLDQVRVVSGTQELGVIADPPASGGSITIPLNDMFLQAGEVATLELRVGIEATAPAAFLELIVDAGGIVATDANLSVAVVVGADSGAELPLTSGVTKLELPPREIVVGLESKMPAVLAADDNAQTVARLTFKSDAGSGAIELDRLILRAADRDVTTVPIGSVVSRVDVYRDGTLWASRDSLTVDSLTASVRAIETSLINQTSPLELDVRVVFQNAVDIESFRLGIDAAGVGVVQPTSALLAVRVEAESGSNFPLWTEAGGFSAVTLRESYSNFPNPFAAGRDQTTFAYYLKTSARVSLRLLTPRGETVLRLLENEPRAAGLHQTDRWTGSNGLGVVVLNGVYLAELTVHYDDGSTEKLHRKVAVAR